MIQENESLPKETEHSSDGFEQVVDDEAMASTAREHFLQVAGFSRFLPPKILSSSAPMATKAATMASFAATRNAVEVAVTSPGAASE